MKMIEVKILIPIWKITTIPLFSVPGQAMASEYFGPQKIHSSVQVK